MKQSFAIMLSFSLLVSIFLQGCGVANQPYVKNDASEAAPLKMIRSRRLMFVSIPLVEWWVLLLRLLFFLEL